MRPSMRSQGTIPFLLFLALVVLYLYQPGIRIYSASRPHPPAEPEIKPDAPQCPTELEHLKRPQLDLTHRIAYSRRCIRPVFSKDIDREAVTNISEPLLPTSQDLDLNSCAQAELETCQPLRLEVPPPYPRRKYSHLLFGVSTSYSRLESSLPTFSHWLANTDARLVALVVDKVTDDDLLRLKDKYNLAGINAVLLRPRDTSLSASQVHFAMIADLVAYASRKTQWLGILDDDTFFPALYPLSAALSTYDHTKPAYLGTLAEDLNALRLWGYNAFGGAGIFLSLPLATTLVPHIGSCIKENKRPEGDVLIAECIYKHSTAKLALLPGLNQQDLRDPMDGWFESGVRPLSLHHWKSWYHEPVADMAAVAPTVCGDCFLQRWRFGTDTILTNGFSIAVYRDGHGGLDLDYMEKTFKDNGDFSWSMGPFRPRLGANEKKSYKLAASESVPGKRLRQTYIFRGNRNKGERDEVFEIFWEV